jgi:hypothetical protein
MKFDPQFLFILQNQKIKHKQYPSEKSRKKPSSSVNPAGGASQEITQDNERAQDYHLMQLITAAYRK